MERNPLDMLQAFWLYATAIRQLLWCICVKLPGVILLWKGYNTTLTDTTQPVLSIACLFEEDYVFFFVQVIDIGSKMMY